MYAHVSPVPQLSDMQQLSDKAQLDTAPYNEVKGVLLELISGYTLSDLPNSPAAPSSVTELETIVQSAVDTVHRINEREIMLDDDCAPRNFIIPKGSQAPFIMDFAQCRFKDRIVEANEAYAESQEDAENEEGAGQDKSEDDWDSDVEYWEQAITSDNPGAIGAVMANVLRRTKGWNLNIKYPDRQKVLSDIKSHKT